MCVCKDDLDPVPVSMLTYIIPKLEHKADPQRRIKHRGAGRRVDRMTGRQNGSVKVVRLASEILRV